MNRLKILLLLFCLLILQNVKAQAPADNEEGNPAELLEIYEHISNTLYDINSLSGRIGSAQNAQLSLIERMVNQMDIRWQIWYQANQAGISQDDSLTTLAANYEIMKGLLIDSIASRRRIINSVSVFRKAEKAILQKDSIYQRMLRESKIYSLTQNTAQQLVKLKMREQLLIKDIDSNYNSAKEAAGMNSHLTTRMAALEEHYINLKSMSESIQAAQYQNFIQKWKDQLIGLAIFAVIGVLIASVTARLKSVSDAKKAQKKMEEMMKRESEEYPTI